MTASNGVRSTANEAVVVVDAVASAGLSNLGWEVWGRPLMRKLDVAIRDVMTDHEVSSLKCTGSQYVLTFGSTTDAADAMRGALAASRYLSGYILEGKGEEPADARLKLRFALHFGEVDVINGDRGGPAVVFALRLSEVTRKTFDVPDVALVPLLPSSSFPSSDFALLSEAAVKVLCDADIGYRWESIGSIRVRDFLGYHDAFLLRELSERGDPLKMDSVGARINLCYCYSVEDRKLQQHLQDHLSILKRTGIIDEWRAVEIVAGQELERELRASLDRAHLIVLLISANFLASDDCYNVQLKEAMDRHHAGSARVIPVLLRAVTWDGAPFAELQVLPKDGRAVTSWENLDEAMMHVVQSIREAAEFVAMRGQAKK